jgi:peptidoglycan/LPS O-acetylase OafA/YrhL
VSSGSAQPQARPRRTWLGVGFAVLALGSLVACVPQARDADWLAVGRRATFGTFFALYAYGHFRWPHTRWPRRGERAAAALVLGYLGCVAASMTV